MLINIVIVFEGGAFSCLCFTDPHIIDHARKPVQADKSHICLMFDLVIY